MQWGSSAAEEAADTAHQEDNFLDFVFCAAPRTAVLQGDDDDNDGDQPSGV